MHAYASAVDTAVLKTLRSILLTRPGLEGRAKGAGILQELIKLLPADLFRVCLAKVHHNLDPLSARYCPCQGPRLGSLLLAEVAARAVRVTPVGGSSSMFL